MFPITLLATSGNLSHGASVTLTTEPVVSVRTFQSSSLLYLESSAGADVARVGMETAWGGSIVEVSLNGEDFVNAHDAVREVQLAQFDGDGTPWNPNQGGDIYNHGSPILAQTVTGDSIYVQFESKGMITDRREGHFRISILKNRLSGSSSERFRAKVKSLRFDSTSRLWWQKHQ